MTKPGFHSLWVTITGSDHLLNSPDGNPRFRLHLSTGATVETKPDAALNYGIENHVGKGPVILTLDTKGHAVYVADACPNDRCCHAAHVGFCYAWEMSGGASGMRQRCQCTTSSPTAKD